MDPFTYTSSPSHVVFGSGAIHQLRAELLRLGANRPLIVTGPRQARDAVLIERILNDSTSSQSSPHATADSKHFLGAATIFSDAAAQTPVEVTERVLNLFLVCRADSIISLGGGSAIGLGKALSIRTSTPHIAIPTTYAGSEMTPILGEAFNGKKTTRSDPKILPSAVIYDVDLTVSLPLDMSLTSGVNAMAHAVEALYARDGNPVIRLLAGEGIRVLGKALPELEGEGDKKGVRERLLYGAWLCAMSVAGVGVGVQHKLAHVLGGSFGLPHATVHTLLLPHTLAYNSPCIPDALEVIAQSLPSNLFPNHTETQSHPPSFISSAEPSNEPSDPPPATNLAVSRLNAFLASLPLKTRSLKDLGMKESDIDVAAAQVVQGGKVYWNPRPLEVDGIREVVRRVWAGEEARVEGL